MFGFPVSAQVLARKVPPGDQLIELVNVVMDGLTDSQPMGSNGACVVLNGITKLRGDELGSQACTLFCLRITAHCLAVSVGGLWWLLLWFR